MKVSCWTFKTLQDPNYFIFNTKQKSHVIFRNIKAVLTDKPNESKKYIISSTNFITLIIVKNLAKLNKTFVTRTSNTIKYLLN